MRSGANLIGTRLFRRQLRGESDGMWGEEAPIATRGIRVEDSQHSQYHTVLGGSKGTEGEGCHPHSLRLRA